MRDLLRRRRELRGAATTQPPPLLPTPATPATRPGHIEQEEPAATLAPLYHLVLLDDDDHTYDYVIEMLGSIFGYGREKAFTLASLVDGEGRVVVETAGLERVTGHQQRIHAYGPDPRIERCKGSMSATIEEANGTGEG